MTRTNDPIGTMIYHVSTVFNLKEHIFNHSDHYLLLYVYDSLSNVVKAAYFNGFVEVSFMLMKKIYKIPQR